MEMGCHICLKNSLQLQLLDSVAINLYYVLEQYKLFYTVLNSKGIFKKDIRDQIKWTLNKI